MLSRLTHGSSAKGARRIFVWWFHACTSPLGIPHAGARRARGGCPQRAMHTRPVRPTNHRQCRPIRWHVPASAPPSRRLPITHCTLHFPVDCSAGRLVPCALIVNIILVQCLVSGATGAYPRLARLRMRFSCPSLSHAYAHMLCHCARLAPSARRCAFAYLRVNRRLPLATTARHRLCLAGCRSGARHPPYAFAVTQPTLEHSMQPPVPPHRS